MVEPIDPAVWRRTTRGRLLIVAGLLASWSIAIEARLIFLQVVHHDFYVAQAEAQQENEMTVRARRGDILDRHGRVLAYSVDEDTVYVDPIRVSSIPHTIQALCQALDGCSADETAKLRDRKKRWGVPIRRSLTADQAARVAARKIPGVRLEKEPRRWYPNRELAGHVLGYVGTDQIGLAGLEHRYEKQLRGKPGRLLVQHDLKGNAFSSVGTAPIAGLSLELTIDTTLQHIAERELRAAVEENRAAGGSVVVMEPTSGEILAMANWPVFNPNDYNTVAKEERKNRAVEDSYEPGSTFKMITATAALEEKVVTPETMIDTGNGVLTAPGRTYRDTHAHGTIPFHEAIAVSSNIGAIKTGWLLGAERFAKYVKERFGFGTRLSQDFSENAGVLPRGDPSTWKQHEALASVAMGYQISVTPLQMAAAASAIANGGELVRPRVVRAVIDGNRREAIPRTVLRRVASPQTVATLTGILEEVVESGTATLTQIPGFTSAGKTGTSRKVVHTGAGHGYYSDTEYNSSFVGFVPSRKPALTIIVWIDTPRAGKTYGGVVAGPVFQRIATHALRHLAVPPNVNPTTPVFVHRDRPNEVRVAGPLAPLSIVAPSPGGVGELRLPELRGLGAREALGVLARLGVSARLTGEGIVLDQAPLPGTQVEPGMSCRLVLGRSLPREQAVKAGGDRP